MTPHSPTENVVAMVICRDAAATLPATLASVLAERPGAIIVAWTPAGAADATPAIVQRLAPEAELLRVETPGIAAARNAAVAAALARGKPLMAWCDADDRWLPGKLAAQVKVLAATEGAQWSVTALAKPDGTLPGFTPSTCLLRTEFVEAVGPWDTRFHLAADHDWMVRARRLAAPAELDAVLVEKGIHAGNASHDRLAYRRELMRWARLQSTPDATPNATPNANPDQR